MASQSNIGHSVYWRLDQVESPHIASPISVISARNVSYIDSANRFQNVNIYLRKTASHEKLIGTLADTLPKSGSSSSLPSTLVHIHGGAWRDPNLTSASIEPAVAHCFTADGALDTVISINYTLSSFPTHPTQPYDASKTPGQDNSREAVHPKHVSDVFHALALLRTLGLKDDAYLLSGHSAGACLAFQSTLVAPSHYGLQELSSPPRPAALIGMNGLYSLPDLVYGLGESHVHLKDVYHNLIGIAFGKDESPWDAASPARFSPAEVEEGVRAGRVPRLVSISQSLQDQLVPVNEADLMQETLAKVSGLTVVRGDKLVDTHAAPWEQGYMIWDTIQDVLKLLESRI